MKYLIVGLGNPGNEYANTRHNAGFQVLDHMVRDKDGAEFHTSRYGHVAEYRFKGRKAILLKPSTYMNLSGKAVRYWMQEEKIGLENLLVITDDLALPFGTLRLRGKGSDGGHNGLKDINATLNTQSYARLRFGIGDTFSRGRQVDYVLSEWEAEEQADMPDILKRSVEIIHSYMVAGLNRTMNDFNKRKS
ncbi:MAG: aminoacyl-tRNA hydrolase [Flavobacteriales bacterium]|nr:aminoacyl-tRNA hydrolase [Flavobacteriales bacterium]NNK80679.1 aminoacyl-tRNA hydrolase [Flavobacteriales bacterium]